MLKANKGRAASKGSRAGRAANRTLRGAAHDRAVNDPCVRLLYADNCANRPADGKCRKALARAFRGATLSVLFGAAFGFTGCGKPAPTAAAQEQPAPPAKVAPLDSSVKPNDAPVRPIFDEARAFAVLKKQCDFGPRVLGTLPHDRTHDYLTAEMKKVADQTIMQEFKYRGMTVSNIVGVIYPAGATAPSKNPIVLMAHWDCRPIADGPFSTEVNKSPAFRYGPKGWNRLTPISGASDAASGVAVLLELARLFHEKKPAVGVLIFLDDAEDYGDFQANGQTGDGTELGAKYFSAHYGETPAFGKPLYGILLDMVGGKNAIFPREQFSQNYAADVNDKVFRIAKELGYGETFQSEKAQGVGDDHISLNERGIPTIDIIHPLPYSPYDKTGYTYWHTLQDTPENCSAKTLKIVGDVVAETIYREKPGT